MVAVHTLSNDKIHDFAMNENAHHFQGTAVRLGRLAYIVFDSCTLVKWAIRPNLVHTPVQASAHLKEVTTEA